MLQALLLSGMGFGIGLMLSYLFYGVVGYVTGLRMSLTLPLIGLVGSLTTIMCMLSASLAVRRVLTADPAEVFA